MLRLAQVRGIGVQAASALVAAAGDGKEFKNGRQFAAWLGLVPRQNSSGGKERLLGISTRGDIYLWTLLIHGARVVLRHCTDQADPLSRWANRIRAQKGVNGAVTALANKTARNIWAMLAKDQDYCLAA